MATAVCFVCLGNICRSPTAAAVMRSLVHDAGLAARIDVDSAGTAGWHVGAPADPRTRSAAQARGIPMDHRARQFTAADFDRFDLVVAMDHDNVSALRAVARTPRDMDKVRLLRSFDPASPPDAPVPDPYYGGQDGFDAVVTMCEAACRGLLRTLLT